MDLDTVTLSGFQDLDGWIFVGSGLGFSFGIGLDGFRWIWTFGLDMDKQDFLRIRLQTIFQGWFYRSSTGFGFKTGCQKTKKKKRS